MTRKQRSDSLTAKVLAAQEQARGHSVPDGLCPLSDSEQLAWSQYCLSRGSWKDSELRILHRVVRFETELEEIQEEARDIPTVYERPSGDIAEHPIHGAVRNKLKTLQSELRMVGLQCSPDRKAGVGNSGKLVSGAASSSLLAQPVGLIG
jgi:hypothetical protein